MINKEEECEVRTQILKIDDLSMSSTMEFNLDFLFY